VRWSNATDSFSRTCCLNSAIQLLILGRVPPEAGLPPGKAAAWFPLVGAALGAAGAGIYLLVPPSFAALACVAFWTLAGRVLHESRLAYVLVAIGVLAKWLALENFAGSYFATPGILVVCVAAQAVPRAAIVGLAWVSRPAGTGLGYALSSTLTTPAAVAAIAQGILAAFFCGARAGAVLIAGTFLIARLAREYSYKRRGGVNGNCLGATEQLLEIFILTMFACRACAW
jgi:adenosylcobinamide-GDP ribazoletransferase